MKIEENCNSIETTGNEFPSFCGNCRESTDFNINTKQQKPLYVVSLVCVNCGQEQKVKISLSENETDIMIQVLTSVLPKIEQVFFDEHPSLNQSLSFNEQPLSIDDPSSLSKPPFLNGPTSFGEPVPECSNISIEIDIKTESINHLPEIKPKLKKIKIRPKRSQLIDPLTNTMGNHYICANCNQIFSSRREIGKHFHTHMKHSAPIHPMKRKRTQKCRMCELGFNSLTKRNLHEAESHKSINGFYQCSLCTYTHKTPQKIRKHIVTEHTDFQCNECNLNFNIYKLYQNHMKHHQNSDKSKTMGKQGNTVSCRFCDQKMVTYPERKKHEDEKHRDPKTGYFQCTYCEFSNKDAFMMSNHMKNHQGVLEIICEICGRRYSHEKALRQHIWLIHQENRPFACTFKDCKKTFKKQYILTQHLQRHSGIRPYKCAYCPKAFKDLTDRRRHQYTHGMVEPKFECDRCLKKFFEKKDIRQHSCKM